MAKSCVSPMDMDFVSPMDDEDMDFEEPMGDEDEVDYQKPYFLRTDNPVSKAIVSHDVTALKEALANPDNIKYLNPPDGGTPLHTACCHEDLDCVKVLLDNPEVDFTVKDNLGLTPVHLACTTGNLDILKLFIEEFEELSADCFELMINIVSSDGETPLHFAASNPNAEVLVPYLLEHKACAIIADDLDNYPSYYCRHPKVKKMLLEKEDEQSKEMEEEEDIESIAEELSKM